MPCNCGGVCDAQCPCAGACIEGVCVCAGDIFNNQMAHITTQLVASYLEPRDQARLAATNRRNYFDIIEESGAQVAMDRRMVEKKYPLSEEAQKTLDETLLKTCAHGAFKTVKRLIGSGANVNYRYEVVFDYEAENFNENPRVITPLYEASRNGHTNVVRLLLANKANPGVPGENVDSDSPIFIASKNGHLDVLKLLVETNGLPGSDGESPLMMACKYEHEDITSYLLEHNADPNYENDIRENAMIYAIAECNEQLVDLLLQAGATPDNRVPDDDGGYDGETGLEAVSRQYNDSDPARVKSIVRKLIDAGSRLGNALHQAVQHGYLTFVRILIEEHGVDINLRNDRNATPIMIAAQYIQVFMVQYLAWRGADVNLVDVNRKTVLTYACHKAFVYNRLNDDTDDEYKKRIYDCDAIISFLIMNTRLRMTNDLMKDIYTDNSSSPYQFKYGTISLTNAVNRLNFQNIFKGAIQNQLKRPI